MFECRLVQLSQSVAAWQDYERAIPNMMQQRECRVNLSKDILQHLICMNLLNKWCILSHTAPAKESAAASRMHFPRAD
jgi:hypothetical protein